MSFSNVRQLVIARQIVGDQVIASLAPLEEQSHNVAMSAASCVAVVLQAHRDAGLGPAVGMDALTLLAEASRLAAESRAKIGAAHEVMRLLAVTHNIPLSSGVDCPPNESETVINPFRGA